MENSRTADAREHDDSALIDNSQPAPSQGESSGGNMARDIGSQAELTRVDEPDAMTRVRKEDAIEHAQEQRPDRPRAPDNG